MLIGVNLASGGFGTGGSTVPGIYNQNYTYPTQDEYQYYAGKGMKVMRLAFLIERLINSITDISFRTVPLNGVSPTMTDIQAIDQQIAWGQQYGLIVLLDPVGFGSMFGQVINSSATYQAFASFWGLMAARYKNNANVWFGLMNEPYQQTAAQWFAAINPAIAAIRNAGAKQLITIPGTGYTAASNWFAVGNDKVFTPGAIVDSANNNIIEIHQYLDNAGGTTCTIAMTGQSVLDPVTVWARTNGFKLFLGELGVCVDSASLSALQATLAYMQQNSDVWTSYTYFAGGPWWGTYYYTIEPTGLGTATVTDQPQMGVLTQFVGGGSNVATGTVTVTSAAGGSATANFTVTATTPDTVTITATTVTPASAPAGTQRTLTVTATSAQGSPLTFGTPVLTGVTFTPIAGQPAGQAAWSFIY